MTRKIRFTNNTIGVPAAFPAALGRVLDRLPPAAGRLEQGRARSADIVLIREWARTGRTEFALADARILQRFTGSFESVEALLALGAHPADAELIDDIDAQIGTVLEAIANVAKTVHRHVDVRLGEGKAAE